MNEYVSRRELLVMLLAVDAGGRPEEKAKFIQKVIKLKADDMETLFTGHEMFFSGTNLLARETYRDLLMEARTELLKGRKRTASAKGQLEYILGALENMFRRNNPFDNDNGLEEACHYIYASLKDYLQLSTRDTRLWFFHPLGDEWVSNDKLTMVHTIMCLPGHVFDDKVKLFLMATALRPDVVTFNTFVDLTSPVVKSNELTDWMYRTQRLVPISEMNARRNIRCIARQDKLASLAKYLMSFTDGRRRGAETVIETLPMAIGITGSEMRAWVGEMKKIDKNRKKMPVDVNSSRLDLLWLLANVTDPNKPEEGLAWMTDAWHHNADNEEAFLRGRFNAAAVKSKLINVREQINSCTDPDAHTDANKFTNVIGVLNGLFQNEKVVTDRIMGLQLIQLRNHLPYYLELGNNYVAEWNASLPTTVERSIKKEIPMSALHYPVRRRLVGTILSSKHLYEVTKAELLLALASNTMNTIEDLVKWMTAHLRAGKHSEALRQSIVEEFHVLRDVTDSDEIAIRQLMHGSHNLTQAPGMAGNANLAKFLEIYEGYLGISQRMHDEFYNSNKESQMKPTKLHLVDAAVSCSANPLYPLHAINMFILELCADDVRNDVPAYLVKKGIRGDYATAYIERLQEIVAFGNDDTYRHDAIGRINKYLRDPQQSNAQKTFGCCQADNVLAAIAKTDTLSAAELATLTTVPAPQATLGSLGLGNAPEPTSYFRPAVDVSHERYPYVGANPALLETMVSVFTADPVRGLRTLLELSVAKLIMRLTDEQLDGAYTYLFRHSTIGPRLAIPPCDPSGSNQEKLEHLLFWTLMLGLNPPQPQPHQQYLGQPSSAIRMTDDRIATVFSYIGNIEKREILIRVI